jgi:hypothetical protein
MIPAHRTPHLLSGYLYATMTTIETIPTRWRGESFRRGQIKMPEQSAVPFSVPLGKPSPKGHGASTDIAADPEAPPLFE